MTVFLIGYVKLLWTNQYLRRQEAFDEEKRSHLDQVRRTGLPASRKYAEIPFGVRAIQSGVQVDGIWISKTSTLTAEEQRPAAAQSWAKRGAEQGKERNKLVRKSEARRRSSSATQCPPVEEDDARLDASEPDPEHPEEPAPQLYRPPIPIRVGHMRNSSESEVWEEGKENKASSSSSRRPTVQTYRVPERAYRSGRDDNALPQIVDRQSSRSSASSTEYETPDENSHPTPARRHDTRRHDGQTRQLASSGSGHQSSASTAHPTYRDRLESQSRWTTDDLHMGTGWGGAAAPGLGMWGEHANSRTWRNVNPRFEVLPAGAFGTHARRGDGNDEEELEPTANEPWRS